MSVSDLQNLASSIAMLLSNFELNEIPIYILVEQTLNLHHCTKEVIPVKQMKVKGYVSSAKHEQVEMFYKEFQQVIGVIEGLIIDVKIRVGDKGLKYESIEKVKKFNAVAANNLRHKEG